MMLEWDCKIKHEFLGRPNYVELAGFVDVVGLCVSVAALQIVCWCLRVHGQSVENRGRPIICFSLCVSPTEPFLAVLAVWLLSLLWWYFPVAPTHIVECKPVQPV